MVKILPPSLSTEGVKMDDFYAARSNLIPTPPWPNIALPFSYAEGGAILEPGTGNGDQQVGHLLDAEHNGPLAGLAVELHEAFHLVAPTGDPE